MHYLDIFLHDTPPIFYMMPLCVEMYKFQSADSGLAVILFF